MAQQKWYPTNWPPGTPNQLLEFSRRALDFIYQIRDTLGPLMLSATGLGTQTITTDANNAVEGLALNLSRSGNWFVQVALQASIADDSQDFTVSLRVGGTIQAATAVYNFPAQPVEIQLTGLWPISVAAANTMVSVTISKAAGAGTSTLDLGSSSIVATWQGV